MERPNSKPIGVITIDVYEGNQTFCSFKGNVPAPVLMGVRVSLPRDYYYHLSALSTANQEKIEEDNRVANAAVIEADRKNLAEKQAKEELELKAKQEIEEAELELKSVKATVITDFTQVELRRHDQVLKVAELKLSKLLKEDEVVEEEKEEEVED